ncbi:MAG: protein kinase [Acidobacteriota bacterium]|nr:protein kinase [Acidobacteriota bacterium]
MTPEQFHKLSGLYHAALDLEPGRRESFLLEHCQGDDVLRKEVEQLLAANNEAGAFLNEPAINPDINVEEPDTAMIGRVFGHYQIISHLGAGGMGEVYLAMDEKLSRKIALKLLPVEFATDPDRLRRFATEAKSASATDHPNIVTIHEIGETDGIHYIAQEFVEGETLRSRIEQGPIPLLEALNIAHQIANALAAAHNAGIVHRDIKPENIMLRHDGFVKVLDFGLAGVSQTEAMAEHLSNAPTMPKNTAPGMILGTVNYMSPEQTRGQKLDFRSDLWSLGVVLYEMLTGQRPFHGESMPDIFVAILERQPAPLNQSMADPPVQLEQILNKLLAKKREQRYQSSAQLAAELKRFHHRLELDAERESSEVSEPATLFIKQPIQTAEARTIQSPATQEQPRPIETIPPRIQSVTPVTEELAAVARLSRATIVLVIFLFVALIAAASWFYRQQKASVITSPATTELLPERSFNYWLTVQRMRDGKPARPEFQSSGRDFYESGWRFRFNFASPQSGHLYLINEGPTETGVSYWLLFPMPSVNEASAKIEADQTMTTGWFTFTKDTGDEKIWVFWSAQAIRELEAIKADVLNPQAQGELRNPQQRDTVRRLLTSLSQSKSEAEEDRHNLKTAVTGRGDTLIHLVELKHH